MDTEYADGHAPAVYSEEDVAQQRSPVNFDDVKVPELFSPTDEEKAEMIRDASLRYAQHVAHDNVDQYIQDAAKIYEYFTTGDKRLDTH